MKVTISLAQTNIQLGLPERNLELASSAILEAASRGSQLVLLPELWSTGYDLENGSVHAQNNIHLLEKLQYLSTQHSLYIGGSFLLSDKDLVYNTFVLLSPAGERTIYRKIHLFRLMNENRWLQPGDRLAQAALPFGQCGLSICYDLRFPEIFRCYALGGAQILLLAAEWPLARVEHWKTLTRARAIENQVFVAAVNSVGVTGPETFGGSSVILSPSGEALAEADASQETLLTTEIDLDDVAKIRSQIPIFEDRRPDIYQA